MKSIGFIGAGNMGAAIGLGLRSAHPDANIAFYDIDQDKVQQVAEECRGTVCSSLAELFSAVEVLVIAVKPQHLSTLFTEIYDLSNEREFISIAAGKPISVFTHNLRTNKVIRFMPNLAAKVGESVVGISAVENLDPEFRSTAFEAAKAIGLPLEIPERLMPAITGLSGSGIAYVFAFLHALALGGTDAGFSYSQALDIAYSTCQGAVKVLRSEGVSPAEYITRVTSAGGTTIRGIKALEEGGLTPTVMKAVNAAAERAKEIETDL
jgi:pyrroline-5-carboxylate reductase